MTLDLTAGRFVRVHVNLHRARAGQPDCLAVRLSPFARVEGYAAAVVLGASEFTVQPAAQARCAQTQVRAVCAWVTGEVVAWSEGPVDVEKIKAALPVQLPWRLLSFDPRRDTAFHDEGRPVRSADAVICAGLHAWALNGKDR